MTQMRCVFIGSLLSLIILVLVGCSSKEPIKVGVIGTMTGPSSDLSISGRRGVELAVSQINQAGGVNGRLIELVTKDDQNDAGVALEMQKLFVAEDIKFVIGHFTSGMTMGVIDYVNQQDMLLLGPTVSADSLSKQKDHFIRFIASTKEQATILADYAQKKKLESMWIVFDERNKGFTDQLVLNFQTQISEKMGLEVKALAYNPADEESIKKAVAEFEKTPTDGAFVVAGAQDCALMVTQLKAINQSTQFFGPLWANTNELIRKGGQNVNGMVLVGAIDGSNATAEYKAFDDAYRNRFGQAPTFASLYAFETMMTLRDAIEQSKSDQPQVIIDKILEKGTFEGLQGIFTIDAYGDNTRDYLLFEVNDGVVRKVD